MTALTVSQKMDELVRRYIHPPLKEMGFVRRSRTWNREAGGMIDVINLQTSRWNEQSSGSFTINCGVFVPSIYTICWGKNAPSFPKEEDCLVRTRVGSLMTQGVRNQQKDFWWDLDSNTNLDVLGGSLRALLLEKVLPFLNQFDSLNLIRAWWKKQGGWEVRTPLGLISLAIIEHQLGSDADAKELLEDLSKQRNTLWKKRVLEVSARLGIQL